jgi:UDP-glucose 4-epimerase
MNDSRRILITGLSSDWGGRLAQLLERDPGVEAIIGIDTADPRHELQRTEFVRVGPDDGLLRRILRAAAIDTVVDTRLIPDALLVAPRRAHEINVDGTRSVLAACAGKDSTVRKLVFKSSAHYYGCDRDAPAFFTEEMRRGSPPRSAIEADVLQAEQAVEAFAADNRDTHVTILRFAAAIGGDLRTAHLGLLGMPVVPTILGFDPRWQFIHEDDVVDVLAYAVTHDLPGVYNAAADGVLTLSEVVSLLGKTMLPVLPPWGTVFAAVQLRRLGLRVPVEMLRDLRFGRGLDNRRLKAAGYRYRYTSREAVLKLRAHQRLRPLLGRGDESYRYEREVEEFLRWSPSVLSADRRDGTAGASDSDGPPPAPEHRPAPGGESVESLDSLTEAELLEIVASLETDAVRRLREYEAANRARSAVLEALDHQLALRSALGTS